MHWDVRLTVVTHYYILAPNYSMWLALGKCNLYSSDTTFTIYQRFRFFLLNRPSVKMS